MKDAGVAIFIVTHLCIAVTDNDGTTVAHPQSYLSTMVTSYPHGSILSHSPNFSLQSFCIEFARPQVQRSRNFPPVLGGPWGVKRQCEVRQDITLQFLAVKAYVPYRIALIGLSWIHLVSLSQCLPV